MRRSLLRKDAAFCRTRLEQKPGCVKGEEKAREANIKAREEEGRKGRTGRRGRVVQTQAAVNASRACGAP
eukprot:3963733-Prymnesium_polylepis.1